MIFFLWLLGVVGLWPMFSLAMLRSMPGPYESEDYLLCTGMGLFASFFWPISLVILGMTKVVRRMNEDSESVR